ncbi:hypothetical protein D3C78_1560590 [compost metagenome]
MGGQCAQFVQACLDRRIGFLQVQQALTDVHLKARHQQLQGRGHQLPGEGFGELATATHAVVEFYLGAGLFQLVVFHHVVHVANGDQQGDPGYDEQGDHEWCHR